MAFREFTRSCTVPATRGAVWRRVTTPEGINDEMMPFLSMTLPREHRAATMATIPVGDPAGRAPLRLFGVLPIDVDGLTITEMEAGSHFQERSWMPSMKRWEHRRTLTDDHGATVVTDTVGFEPRLPLVHHAMTRLLPLFFEHRHRKLQRHFSP